MSTIQESSSGAEVPRFIEPSGAWEGQGAAGDRPSGPRGSPSGSVFETYEPLLGQGKHRTFGSVRALPAGHFLKHVSLFWGGGKASNLRVRVGAPLGAVFET